MFKVILLGALVVGIAYVAITYNNLWVDKDELTTKLRQSDSLKKVEDALVVNLIQDTTKKGRRIDGLRVQVSDLQKSQQGAQTRYLQARVDQLPLSSQLIQTIASYDAKQKKLAADELVDGIGEMGLSVNDSVANGKIATLKGKHKNLVTVYVPSLEEANATLSQQKIDLDTQLALERSHGLDLVDEVNGKNKAFNRLQSVTQSQISKAQKGLLGPVLHGPRIKSLQVVSDSISKVQH